MTSQHKDLASGRWNSISFFSQMSNIGSEVSRALGWYSKNHMNSLIAAERAVELLDLTIDDPKNHTKGRLVELLRLREFLADYFFFNNEYHSNEKSWHSYFNSWAYAASLERGL